MRWMAIVLGMGLACVGCKDDKKDEPVEVSTDEAKAEDDKKDEAKADDKEAAESEDEEKSEGETKTAKADEDDADKDEDAKDEDEKDEDEKDEDEKDDEGETKTAEADDDKPAATAATKTPFGAGGLSGCCAALDAQAKSTSGSNASRLAAASRQCFHLDGLVAQGKTTKGAALSQLKALAGTAPAACN